VLLACSVFRPELEALARARWPGLELHFLSSMLHMEPPRLERRLLAELGEVRRAARPVGLVYGDCCAGMSELAAGPGVARVGGVNCPATLLDRETYRRLSHDGAFFLLPEWAGRWREVFEDELGLDAAIAPGFMADLHRKLVYLDTGVVPVPRETLEACSRFTALPFEVFPVPLVRLAELVEAALERLTREAR
jgi:hypothetical protein